MKRLLVLPLILVITSIMGQQKQIDLSTRNHFKNSVNKNSVNQRRSTTPFESKADVPKDGSFWLSLSEIASARKAPITKGNFQKLLKPELGIKDNDYFELVDEFKDKLGDLHTKFQLYHKNVKVIGNEIILHQVDNQIKNINGKRFTYVRMDVVPTLTSQDVINGLSPNQSILVEPELVIAKHQNDYRLLYKLGLVENDPFDFYDAYFDAHTGQTVKRITNIHDVDVTGSAETFYRGTQAITTDSFNGSFRLQESTRGIQTFDATNASFDNTNGFVNFAEIVDDDNNWTGLPYLKQVTLNIADQSWWFATIVDQQGDFYIQLIDGNDQIVCQSSQVSNAALPITFNTNCLLVNPPYKIRLWDQDILNDDDFGGEYVVNTAINTHNFADDLNSGTYQVNSLNNPALDVHWGMEKTYDYYLEKFARNSFDNAGSVIKNFVNGAFQVSGTQMNASAFGPPFNFMVYGLGGGSWGPVVGLDVAGHEFTHMVINSSANLVYEGESGALNESFADIFGSAIEHYTDPVSANWKIGEDVVVGSALRDMSSPNIHGHPDTYNGQFWKNTSLLNNDHGGVHTNSGVQNFWFYLLSEGGSGTNDLGNTYSVTGIGIEKAQQIAYRNLTVYLTSTSNYQDAKNGSIQAAEDLYGNGSAEYNSVIDAWYAVGVGNSTSTNTCIAILKFNDAEGTFSDGSGSGSYGNNLDCMWLIQPEGATSLDLTFTELETEQDIDGIIVYDGPSVDDNVIATISGSTLPSTITSSSGALLVRFLSDESNTFNGWTASYAATGQPSCSGLSVLSSSTGSFTNVESSNYGNNQACLWYLAPPGAESVTLSFESFSTEQDFDGVEIYDDLSVDQDDLIASYTGQTTPPDITSTTGKMLVVFISDYSTTDTGFVANYSSVGEPYCTETTLVSDYDSFEDGSGTSSYYGHL